MSLTMKYLGPVHKFDEMHTSLMRGGMIDHNVYIFIPLALPLSDFSEVWNAVAILDL